MTGPRRRPLRVVRQRGFLLYSLNRIGAALAGTMLTAVVFWEVHEISSSAYLLAAVGLVRFVPNLLLSLPAGAIADRYNARHISMAALSVQAIAAIVLAAAAAGGGHSLLLIYLMVALIAAGSAIDSPARGTLLPRVVDPGSFADAIVVNGTVQQFAFVSGPVAGGFILAASGPAVAFGAIAAVLAGSTAVMAFLRPRPLAVPGRRPAGVRAVTEGIRFAFSRQAILAAMALDMFAVIFGGATALFPIFARDILEVGAVGYGLLFAAVDVGALLMSIALVLLPPVRRTGTVLIAAVVGFGLATVVFGLSRWFPLSLAALFCVGLFDEISVVMRQTTIQLSTPDELRGRVTSVNMLFIGTSNQLGPVESGLVAGLVNPTFSVVSGGLGVLGVVAIIAWRLPALRRYRLEPHADTAPGGAAGGS